MEKRQIQYLKYCELPAATENRTFETFNAYTPRLKDALEAAKDVVNGKISLLVLASGVDRGKSHLAIAICRAWLAKGKSAKYAFVPDMLDELKDGFLHKGEESYYDGSSFTSWCHYWYCMTWAQSKDSWELKSWNRL
jgi:DNA replication protein DnaC